MPGAVLFAMCLATATLPIAAPAGAGSSQSSGWIDLDRRLRPPGSDYAAMAYDEARGELVLVPQYDAEGRSAGTWVRRGGTWRPARPAVEPPTRFAATIAYDAARREVVLFGGYGAGDGPESAVNDTWIWDGTSWRHVEPPVSPTRRAFAAAAYDAVHERVVLFGGIGFNEAGENVVLGDTWTWDGETWSRADPAISPEIRASAAMAYDEAREEIVLFGGDGVSPPKECVVEDGRLCVEEPSLPDQEEDTHGILNDTWVWDGQTWTERTPTNAPPVRTGHAMAYDPFEQEIVVFGGINWGGELGDTWTWNGVDWAEADPVSSPAARPGATMAADRQLGQLVLFGGSFFTHRGADTWGWNGTTWTSLDAPTPPGRYGTTLAADPGSDGAVLFGGLGHSELADTWRWSDGWEPVFPTASPPRRAFAASTADPVRGEIVVFGGLGESGSLSDTWAWDGQTWTDRTPALPSLSPVGRYGAAMAYDAARDETILFGGRNSQLDLMLSDTWTWDGAAWEPKLVTGERPPAVLDSAMVYDPLRQEVVLFGGRDEAGEAMGETWTWDGEGWTLEAPSAAPSARSGASMVWDPALERVLLLGGSEGAGLETWAWDGANWQLVDVPGAPDRRRGAGAAWIPSLGGTLLFGGLNQGAGDETWLLRVPPTPAGG